MYYTIVQVLQSGLKSKRSPATGTPSTYAPEEVFFPNYGLLGDRTNPSLVMDLFSMPRQIALKSWLKRRHGNLSMQEQDGWMLATSLLASNRLMRDVLDASRILYIFCGSADFCRRCCLDKRIQPALDEYGMSFDRAPYW